MSLIKCPECKKSISSKSKTCIHCGFPIPDNITSLIECPECKELISNESIVCIHCGSFIHKGTGKDSTKTKPINKKLVIISVVLGIILLVGIGILIYRQTTINKFKDVINDGLISASVQNILNEAAGIDFTDDLNYENLYDSFSIVEIYKSNSEKKSSTYEEGAFYMCFLYAEPQNGADKNSGYYCTTIKQDAVSGKLFLWNSKGPCSYNVLPSTEGYIRIV